MRAWAGPAVPPLPGSGPQLRLFDTVSGELRPTSPGERASMYVCGITPYDATHMGHAATYVAFDVVNRYWRDRGHTVSYVQNVTDIDDPLLERAVENGQDWRRLADDETEAFRSDMAALRVLPPDHYIGAVESVPAIVESIRRLQEKNAVYQVGEDLYFDLTADPSFGGVAGLPRAQMVELFAERGGDPQREGKRDPLDPLLWQSVRPGEPSWHTELGDGRPGWHIECTAIAAEYLGLPLDLQGGGSDLTFPHHEMCASLGTVEEGAWPFARLFVHTGMVGLDGHKMSKSRGNLVLVRSLRAAGHDPMAVRLALLAHHYRGDWEWTDAGLQAAEQRLQRWREAISTGTGPDPQDTVARIRECLADDLDSPRALAAADRWADAALTGGGSGDSPRHFAAAVDALLGVDLDLAPPA